MAGQITEKQWLANIQTGLVAELGKNEKALPPGFNRDRFTLNCITVITDMLKDNSKKKALQQVDPMSIPICLAKGAYLGLDFFNGECYAIPYGGQIQFQTDYKGEIKLCKRWSKNPIKDIFAKVVREGDFFEEEVDGGGQNIVFKPKPFSNAPMVGAFAIVVFKDGSMMYDTMSKEEIENVRDVYSKAKNSQAWKDSPGEMFKKTVIRRLCKLIDLDFDNKEQQRAYVDGGDVEFQNGQPVYIDGRKTEALPDNGGPIDVFAQMAQQAQEQPREALPVKATQENPKAEQQAATDDYQAFEEQFGQQPPVSDDFIIPDEVDNELPFK